jgi:mRNA interferase MazF
LSPDIININGPVVLIASITSKKTDRIYPFEALIEPPEGGLVVRSKVLLMQLRSVDRRRIVGSYGLVSEETKIHVEEALKVATGLTLS